MKSQFVMMCTWESEEQGRVEQQCKRGMSKGRVKHMLEADKQASRNTACQGAGAPHPQACGAPKTARAESRLTSSSPSSPLLPLPLEPPWLLPLPHCPLPPPHPGPPARTPQTWT